MVVEAMNFKNGVQVFSLHNNLQKTPSDGITFADNQFHQILFLARSAGGIFASHEFH